MVRRKRLEARGEVADLAVCRADAETPAVVLKHIDACAAVGRVDHHMERAARREHVAQRPQTCIGVGQMMQHARADDVLEGFARVRRRAPTASWRTSRLSSACLRFNSCVNAMLFALTSIPTTLRAASAAHSGRLAWCRSRRRVCCGRRGRVRPARRDAIRRAGARRPRSRRYASRSSTGGG